MVNFIYIFFIYKLYINQSTKYMCAIYTDIISNYFYLYNNDSTII